MTTRKNGEGLFGGVIFCFETVWTRSHLDIFFFLQHSQEAFFFFCSILDIFVLFFCMGKILLLCIQYDIYRSPNFFTCFPPRETVAGKKVRKLESTCFIHHPSIPLIHNPFHNKKVICVCRSSIHKRTECRFLLTQLFSLLQTSKEGIFFYFVVLLCA